MASRQKHPAPAVATCFCLPATLRAWTERILSTRQQATGPGLMGEADAVGDANAAPPLPRQQSCPQSESRTRQAVRLLPGIQQTNGFTIRLAHLAAGEPPDPVPLGRELQASGGRAAATRRPGRPQLQARGQPFPHSWHCGSGAASCQPRRSRHSRDRGGGPPQARSVPHRAPGRRPQRVDNGRGDRRHRPGSRRDAGIGPSRPIDRKTTPQDAAQRP